MFLGIIIGLLLAILVFAILAFFRVGIERKIQIIERLQHIGPQETGEIFMPEEDADVVREEKVRENNKKGLATKLSDLQ